MVFLFCTGDRQYGEVCVFPPILCKYDLRRVDVFVLSLAMVRRVCCYYCVYLILKRLLNIGD